jgi:ubiquinone/menaquinone biosynthesis C-methylase UbiE
METVGIKPTDVVLEIGCGIGRVGRVLAPICREWIGADVSENMINHLRQRLKEFKNVRTVVLGDYFERVGFENIQQLTERNTRLERQTLVTTYGTKPAGSGR